LLAIKTRGNLRSQHFPSLFSAKQKEIRAGDEKEAFPTKMCQSNTERWTLIFGFPEQTVSPSARRGANVPLESTFSLEMLLKLSNSSIT
jgi:hypothetical protein